MESAILRDQKSYICARSAHSEPEKGPVSHPQWVDSANTKDYVLDSLYSLVKISGFCYYLEHFPVDSFIHSCMHAFIPNDSRCIVPILMSQVLRPAQYSTKPLHTGQPQRCTYHSNQSAIFGIPKKHKLHQIITSNVLLYITILC